MFLSLFQACSLVTYRLFFTCREHGCSHRFLHGSQVWSLQRQWLTSGILDAVAAAEAAESGQSESEDDKSSVFRLEDIDSTFKLSFLWLFVPFCWWFFVFQNLSLDLGWWSHGWYCSTENDVLPVFQRWNGTNVLGWDRSCPGDYDQHRIELRLGTRKGVT